MSKFISLIRWFAGMWPVLVPAAFAVIHYLLATNPAVAWSNENKVVSLALQIVGGVLVLYSIDSNLGIANNTSLFAIFVGYLKRFPLIKRSYTLNVDSAQMKVTVHPVKMRVGGPTNTTEEKIKYLQQQIDWLKEDLRDEVQDLKKMLAQAEERSGGAIAEVRENVGSVDRKITGLSTGGIKTQIFGVLLMIHGSLASYYA